MKKAKQVYSYNIVFENNIVAMHKMVFIHGLNQKVVEMWTNL